MYSDITSRIRWHSGTRDTNYTNLIQLHNNVLFTLKAGEVLESMGCHIPPVSAVWTAVSARQFYTKIFEPQVAYALGSVYLLCARTCG